MPRLWFRFRIVLGTLILGLIFGTLTATQAKAQTLAGFRYSDFQSGSAKIAGIPFAVTLTAIDQNGNQVINFTNQVNLYDDTGTVYPSQTSNFTNGQWTGNIYITKTSTADHLMATSGTVSSLSDPFVVNADSRMKFISIISGNSQTGTVKSLLPQSLTVAVVDPYANPIANVGVNFSVISVPTNSTEYALSANSGTTNASGRAGTAFTLGRKAGSYIISASLASGVTNTVQFYETGTPSNLISLSVTPTVAVMPAGTILPFKASGYDQYVNEITLSNVSWSVQNGGGTIDSTGIFTSGNTLGNFSNTIKATSGSIGATASINIVDVWGGTSGAGGSGSGTSSGGSGSGTGTGTGTGEGGGASSSAQPTPTPTPAPGLLYNVQIEPEVLSVLKGARIPIVAEGVDFFGNSVAGASYNFEVSGNLGTLTQTGSNSVLLTASENGIGTVTVTANQGKIAKVAKVVGSVGTGLNRRLVIEDIASPQKVGEPFTISIAAKDSLNNFITDYKGPLVLADSTGTIDPATVQPSDQGIWYVQAIIGLANPEVTITAAGDGMVGVSNIFEVQGDPKKSDIGLGKGAGSGIGGGLGDVLGASISGKIDQILKAKDINKYTVVRYIGAGLAAGIGILGASGGGGLMASKGLEAIGRNPFAKGKLQANLYISLIVFIAAAAMAVFAATMIVK